MPISRRGYKPHVDGLRAIAVTAVIAYHYGGWVPGGFTGVDIFFVISGFLITENIWSSVEKGEFSLSAFYARRMRRILPALIVTILSTVMISIFVLTPGDFRSTVDSALYATFGVGNLYFYGHTGYFDRQSDLQPLLHLWSLGVEEQFYLLWPAFLIVVAILKPKPETMVMLIGLLLTIGLIYSAYAVATDPKAAFYLPFSRAWELLAGATAAMVSKPLGYFQGRIASAAGALLVSGSLALISSQDAFPGFNALPAVVGTTLIVAAKNRDFIIDALSFRPAVWIGKISYSLYLWHWPVLVIYRHYSNGENPTAVETAFLLCITVILGALSWIGIEVPFRRRRNAALPTVYIGLGTMIAAALALALASTLVKSENEMPAMEKAVSSLSEMWEWRCPELVPIPGIKTDACAFGEKWATASKKIVLWGDSHAEHLAPLLEISLPENTAVIIINDCPAILGGSISRVREDLPDYVNECSRRRAAVFTMVNSDSAIKGTILAASWGPLLHVLSGKAANTTETSRLQIGLDEVITGLSKKIVIVGQIPQSEPSVVECRIAKIFHLLRRDCAVPQPLFDRTSRVYGDVVDPIFRKASDGNPQRIHMISLENALCGTGQCLVELNGEPIYRDDSHIRRNLTEPTKRQLAGLLRLPGMVDWLLR